MRPLVVLALLLLAACTESSATRIAENTFQIEGPPCASCGDGPNERLASRICQGKGYYVLNSESHRGGPDRATDEINPMTVWTIRCIK
ncbi:MAG: hypothetical protein JO001_03650 [Alphaproteobacteria bacterium]|nr:hypothetical protein [Alphaproteobacteria bacterium]